MIQVNPNFSKSLGRWMVDHIFWTYKSKLSHPLAEIHTTRLLKRRETTTRRQHEQMAMVSQTALCMFSSSSSFGLLLSGSFSKTSIRTSCSSQIPPYAKPTKPHLVRFPRARTRATLDETDQSASTTPFLVQEGKPNRVWLLFSCSFGSLDCLFC